MDANKLAKRAEVEKHQGRRKRGRPQLRWEDCVRRDMRRSGEDERWREGAADRKLCTAGNKEEESTIYVSCKLYIFIYIYIYKFTAFCAHIQHGHNETNANRMGQVLCILPSSAETGHQLRQAITIRSKRSNYFF